MAYFKTIGKLTLAITKEPDNFLILPNLYWHYGSTKAICFGWLTHGFCIYFED